MRTLGEDGVHVPRRGFGGRRPCLPLGLSLWPLDWEMMPLFLLCEPPA